jgi:diketogulonate reductase-like aldo/keto reductase
MVYTLFQAYFADIEFAARFSRVAKDDDAVDLIQIHWPALWRISLEAGFRDRETWRKADEKMHIE